MLLNLHKKKWSDGLSLSHFDSLTDHNVAALSNLSTLTTKYEKVITEEDELSAEKLAVVNVGRQDAKKHIEMEVRDGGESE